MKEASQIFDVAKYLARIGLEEPSAVAGVGRLKLLQRQHLLNVPFENLDIHSKQAIVLDTEKFYRKIVNNNRGGFCYELNGLFNELLRELGFETRILSARVAKGNGEFNPEYDHAVPLRDSLKQLLKFKPHSVSISYKLLARDMVESAHRAGVEVWVWTVNDTGVAEHMRELGADAIKTDRPTTLMNLFRGDRTSDK